MWQRQPVEHNTGASRNSNGNNNNDINGSAPATGGRAALSLASSPGQQQIAYCRRPDPAAAHKRCQLLLLPTTDPSTPFCAAAGHVLRATRDARWLAPSDTAAISKCAHTHAGGRHCTVKALCRRSCWRHRLSAAPTATPPTTSYDSPHCWRAAAAALAATSRSMCCCTRKRYPSL